MDITLYYTHHTRALRPRWLLEELQLPYRLELIDLFGGGGQTPEYKRIHPHGAVPAMLVDGKPMIESGAMCHWLADRCPERGLAPAIGAPQRMAYEQWMFYVPGTLEPLPFQILLHSRILPEPQRVAGMVPWATRAYLQVLKVVNSELEQRAYLAGDAFTAADVMAGSTLMWLPDLLKNYPALTDYVERLQQRPAYRQAATDPSS
jgi:glutathione S-transferase